MTLEIEKEIICNTCQAGPFKESSKEILKFHTDQGHELGEYVEKKDFTDIINEFTNDLESNEKTRELEREERIKEKGTPIEQIQNYLNTRIKNDDILIKQLVRTYLSAYTNNPINIALLAPSSDGKTYATVEVSKIFPKEDIIKVGRLSPTALIHQNGFLIDEKGNNIDEELEELTQKIIDAKTNKDKKSENELKKERTDLLKNASKCVDLTNKILLFLDNPNPATYEMLKPIMSHDSKEITYMTTKGDGSLSVSKSVIRGWPVFIFCSAKNEDKNEVWEEIKTRVFMTSPNSDITKYEEANKLTALKFSRPTWAKSLYHNDEEKKYAKFYIQEFKEKLNELCKDGNNPIINAFDQAITDHFPHTQGVSMRHLTRLMSFINLETLLNYDTNPGLLFTTKEKRFVRSIFTTIEDIDNACQILKNISTVSPEKIKFYNDIFKELLTEKNIKQNEIDEQETQKKLENTITGLTSKDLAEKYTEKFGKPITVKQITENYLKPLVDAGILGTKENPVNISQYLYESASSITVHNLTDLKSTLIDTSTHTLEYIDLCLKDLEEVSIEIGKSKFNFKDNNNRHTDYYLYHNELYLDQEELKEILLGKSQNQSTPKEVNP